jgi:hypothetical protein
MQFLKRKAQDPLRQALRAPIRVALNPDLPVTQRHGSVWFNVDGFGLQRRDFLVDDVELLAQNPKQLADSVAKQIMLLDKTLPKRTAICTPARIDIVGSTLRQVYELPTFDLLLKQPL